jgi:uncharacterized protein
MTAMIRISTGELVDPFNINVMPKREVFVRSLAMLNRYTGHTSRPYSVAEHTCHLAGCPAVKNAGLSRAALLHDFNEALTNDLPHPLKKALPDYEQFEEYVQKRIFAHFNEPWENMEKLVEFDRRICVDEMSQLFNPPVEPWMEPLQVSFDYFESPWSYWSLRLNQLCANEGIF